MDYTTVELVKQEIHAKSSVSVDDALLARLVTAASRALDRMGTGTNSPETNDYYKLEPKNEILIGLADKDSNILVYPHKPYITAVSAVRVRKTPRDEWVSVDPTFGIVDDMSVMLYPDRVIATGCRVQVDITYTGGLGETQAALPADLVEVATVLAARYYKESETGLNDSVGIAELGTIMFTKALPIRVEKMFQPYKRIVGWRLPG